MISSSGFTVLSRDGCDLHYRVDGPSRAPLVVFTPGAFVDHRMFDDQLEAISDRYRLLRWDVRGHGLSRPASTPFTTAQAAEDLAAILDALDEQRIALVGQSIGGNIHQDFVFRWPERCAAAVFLGCTCSTAALGPLDRLLLALTPPIVAIIPTAALKRLAVESSAITAVAQRRLAAMMQSLSAAEVQAITVGIAQAPFPAPGYSIHCPVLVAYGASDRLGNIRKVAARWAERDNAGQPSVIEDAGHVANMDNPVAFNVLLLEFLASRYPA